MSDYKRLIELADRSVKAGKKAEHVSCSEMHEIRDGVIELKAENDKLKADITEMIQKAAAKHLPAYREQGEKMLALVESNEEKDKRIRGLRLALDKIARPVYYMQTSADATGCTLNGGAAVALANDPHYLKDIATNTLEQDNIYE